MPCYLSRRCAANQLPQVKCALITTWHAINTSPPFHFTPCSWNWVATAAKFLPSFRAIEVAAAYRHGHTTTLYSRHGERSFFLFYALIGTPKCRRVFLLTSIIFSRSSAISLNARHRYHDGFMYRHAQRMATVIATSFT